MPRSRKDVPLGVMREVALRKADETSDRQVAEAIGVSPTTVGNWRKGKPKQNKATARKVEQWWAREGHEYYEAGTTEADALLAIKVLIENAPPERRRAAAHAIDDGVRDAYAGAGESIPAAWFRLERLIDTELP